MSDIPNVRPAAAPLPEDDGDALLPGTRLAEFEIRQVLGSGGFGIVYRAWDVALQRDVALKEYMPVSLAGRGSGERVTLRSRTHQDTFALGLQSFVNEARLLARFDQPALVKVLRFWEANGTAYMAMPLYKGYTLRQLRRETAPGMFDDAWTRALIEPLLGALEVMHGAEVYHRDIAPDNILWCDDSRPVLLDFGAARLVVADRTQDVTAILKPQYAPIEQYAKTPLLRQGPWTDLYELAGTCYFMLTGRPPLPATARVMGDEMEPLVHLAPPACSPRLLEVLDWAMAVRPQDRPQSVAEFRDALAGWIPVPVRTLAQASAASTDPASPSSSYEQTILATTMSLASLQRTSASDAPGASSATPVAHPPHEADLESNERSVMLPSKAGSPAKALVLILIVAMVGAGAWTTRQQWMPAVGLWTAALPVTESASSAEALAGAGAPMPDAAPASARVAEASSAAGTETLTVAMSDAPPSAGPTPASSAASVVPAPVAETPPSPMSHAEAANAARSKALATRITAFKLPPPVLPPANESHIVTPARAVVSAAPEAVEPVTSATTPASSAAHTLGPREVCTEQEPANVAACVKRLCDNEPRYQHYPVCQHVHRQEEQPQPQ
jgi:serine/threonine protein kinase